MKIAAWKLVIEGLKAGEYGDGSYAQASLDAWRRRHQRYGRGGYKLLQRRCKPQILEYRQERYDWLMDTARYGDGTPIPTSLPF